MKSTTTEFDTAAVATTRKVKGKIDITWTSQSDYSSIDIEGADPEYDGYYDFSVGNYIQSPIGPGGNNKRTFAFNIAPVSDSEAYTIGLFSSYNGAANYERLYITGTDIRYDRRYSGSYICSWYTGGGAITRATWQTVVVVIDLDAASNGASTGCTVWVGGNQIPIVTGDVSDTESLYNTANYKLGVYVDSANYVGKMKKVVYDTKAWTQDDIDNYENSILESDGGFIYLMNEDDPGSPYTDVTIDSSGNDYHGTPENIDGTFFNPGRMTDINRAANLDQIYDSNTETVKKWAHLDGNIKADGNHKLMPDPDTAGQKEQVGWYGATRSDASAQWSPYPTLTLTFDAKPVLSILVAGDDYNNEYPVDFDVEIYAGSTLEYTEEVTGNTEVLWSKNIASESLTSITKMVLVIKKWSDANRIVKITEFYSDFVQTFEGDEVVSMNLLEERVIGNGSLPVGNISSNEIDIALNNVSIEAEGSTVIDPFFPENSDSIYYELIRQNRRVEPYLGFLLPDNSTEWIKLGVFWTGDWTVDEQSFSASVSCRDRMDLLRKAEYKTSTLFEDQTLYDIAESVLNHASTNIPMPDLRWQIDTELQDYTIPYAWFPKQSYFKSIKQIVEACMGQAYMDKYDVLIIEGPSQITS